MKHEFLSLVLLGLVGGFLYVAATTQLPDRPIVNEDTASVRAFVEEFGTRLKEVSLLSPTAKEDIASVYGPYVDPVLLSAWQAHPESAPGRITSSPWPERIEVISIAKLRLGTYYVEGNIIEITSAERPGDAAAVRPVRMAVRQTGFTLQITEFTTDAQVAIPQPETFVGIWECLPHKDTSGPQTMECAFGISADNGEKHYGISTSLMATYPVEFPSGTRVQVEGILTPREALSSDHWQTYNMVGIISATSIQEI